MACVLTTGRSEPCKDSVGGLLKAYFLDYRENSFTVSAGQGTAMNVAVTQVFEWTLKPDNNTFTEVVTSDKNTGTTSVEQTFEGRFIKQNYQTASEVMLMAYARPIIVLVGHDGSHKVMGITEGCDLTNSNIQSGGTKKDFNGYDLTFTAEELRLAPYLDGATVTALEAVVSATTIAP